MRKKRAKKRKGGSSPSVSVRFANPSGGAMAKKKGGKRRRKGTRRRASSHRRSRRSNPSNPRRSRKRTHHRRRRNPSGGFMDRAAKLAGGALVAVGTGVAETFAMSKFSPQGATMSMVVEYGVPAAVFLTGVAVAKSSPTIGVGMALGAFAPFVLPITSKALAATAPATPSTTAAGISRAYRAMRAVQGRQYGYGMGAVDHPMVGAVNY
jgi:hypothetical protein